MCIIRYMKRLIAIATLLVVMATPAYAETVTCTSSQYGESVCGVSTSTETVVEHQVVETGASNVQVIKLLASVAGAALVATVLYRLTYRAYIFG